MGPSPACRTCSFTTVNFFIKILIEEHLNSCRWWVYGGREGSPAAMLEKPCSKSKGCMVIAIAAGQMLRPRSNCKGRAVSAKATRQMQSCVDSMVDLTSNQTFSYLLLQLCDGQGNPGIDRLTLCFHWHTSVLNIIPIYLCGWVTKMNEDSFYGKYIYWCILMIILALQM